MMPQIQVYIPVYNGMAVFPRTLRSVLAQQGVDLEVIVSDNASVDGTGDYLAQTRANRKRPIPAIFGMQHKSVGAGASIASPSR